MRHIKRKDAPLDVPDPLNEGGAIRTGNCLEFSMISGHRLRDLRPEVRNGAVG